MNIKNIVNKLVKKYGTHDPETIIKELNIKIIDCDFPENINGLYLSFPNTKVIMVNNCIYDNHRKIVLAHELAHHILHKNFNHIFVKSNTFFNIGKLETEADRFVLELLFHNEDFDTKGISNNILDNFLSLEYS